MYVKKKKKKNPGTLKNWGCSVGREEGSKLGFVIIIVKYTIFFFPFLQAVGSS